MFISVVHQSHYSVVKGHSPRARSGFPFSFPSSFELPLCHCILGTRLRRQGLKEERKRSGQGPEGLGQLGSRGEQPEALKADGVLVGEGRPPGTQGLRMCTLGATG